MIGTCERPRSRPRTRVGGGLTLATAVLIVGLVAVTSCSDGGFIDRLTIANGTPYDVDVDVSDAKKTGWRRLGQATHQSSTVIEAVADAGPVWVFRFRHEGRTVGELTVERDELRRERWRVEVPSAVADRLRDLDVEPPPDE